VSSCIAASVTRFLDNPEYSVYQMLFCWIASLAKLRPYLLPIAPRAVVVAFAGHKHLGSSVRLL